MADPEGKELRAEDSLRIARVVVEQDFRGRTRHTATLTIMPPAVSIRRYAPTDEEAVMVVWSQAASLAHPFVAGEGTGWRAEQMREVYLIQADNWVAQTEAGRVVGLLGMLGAEIGGLFVDPSAQGKGIGRLLVEHAAHLHGELTVEVYELNERARRFYEHIGFVPIGQRVEDDTGLTLFRLRWNRAAPA